MPQKRGSKEPKTNVTHAEFLKQRKVRTVSVAEPSGNQSRPKFSFEYADRVHRGQWWWPSSDGLEEVVNFLCDISKSSWEEIRLQRTGSGRQRHHQQQIESIAPEGIKLISALGLDERFDELFRFRIGYEKRLWGFLRGDIFYILWWDPDHKVYPLDHD